MARSVERLIWGEHEYVLPTMPNEKDILFHDMKKEDQYWRKPKIPQDGDGLWDNMSTQQRFKFVERERERQANGLWFMNKGKPTYITGTHYDHLVYQTFDYRPRYLESQRHDFYFRDLLKKDNKTYGGLIIKPRRYGYTDMEVTNHQVVAISDFHRKTGMMSDTRDKVYETLYDKITASYIHRPKYTRPDVFLRNGLIPRKKMVFESGKVGKSASANKLNFDHAISLHSKITPKATSVMGYDGQKLHYLTLDEIWKWTKVSPIGCWDKQKKTLFDGGTIIGKAMLLSTMGDDDDYERAIREGIQMWHDSNPLIRDLNGMTNTGLYRYFVPGWYALFAPEMGYVDRYGFINQDMATTYIMNERSKYEEGSLEWTYEVRRYPLTIEEALSSALVEGVFDKKRIDTRINELNGIINAETKPERITIINKIIAGDKPYVEGKLTMDNNDRVHFEPDKNEPWLIHKLPYISKDLNIDKSNRWAKFGQEIMCPRNPEGAIGYDPIRYVKTDTVSKSISNAAISAKYKFDYFRTGKESAAGKRAGLYLHRPDDPDEANFEVLKAAKFWGFKIMYERQVESFIKLVRHPSIQMMDFILNGDDGKPGMWTNANVWTNGVNQIRSLWKQPKDDFDRDYLMEEPFIPLLQQGKDFNPKRVTIFDAIVSEIELNKGLSMIMENLIPNDFDFNNAWEKVENEMFPRRKY